MRTQIEHKFAIGDKVIPTLFEGAGADICEVQHIILTKSGVVYQISGWDSFYSEDELRRPRRIVIEYEELIEEFVLAVQASDDIVDVIKGEGVLILLYCDYTWERIDLRVKETKLQLARTIVLHRYKRHDFSEMDYSREISVTEDGLGRIVFEEVG